MVTDPEHDRRLEEGRRQRFHELMQQIDEHLEADGLPPTRRAGRRDGLRLAYYPPVEIDKQVLEWFAKRTGNRMALTFALNRVLLDYIDAYEKRPKKAG